MNKIRELFKTYDIVELVADTAHFELPLAILSKEGYPVVAMPQNDSRMGGPTVTLFKRIKEETVSIVRDDTLTAHFLNAHFTETQRGGKIHKGPKKQYKIDGAVAAIMATSRALFHASQPVKRPAQMIGFK